MGFFDWWRRNEAEPPAARAEPTIQNVASGDWFSDLSSVTEAGVMVNEQSAMRVAAVHACVQLIAGIIATLPLHFYQRAEAGRDRVDHDYWWLFNESASSEYTAASLWEFVLEARLLHGDGFARLVRGPGGRVREVVPLDPRRVDVKRRPEGWRLYTYWGDDGKVVTLHEDDVLHFPGLGFDGLRSLSPIRHHAGRTAVGLALAQDEFAQRSLGQGNHSDLLLSTVAKLDEAQKAALRKEVEERYGGLANTRRPMVLSGEFKLDRLRANPIDVQLMEARQFQVVDIARIYGVPPHMIGATDKTTSWGSGIESMTLGFVKFTLRRHLEVMQQELNRKLFPRSARLYCEFDLDALLEGDSKAQADYLAKAVGGPGAQGWMTINEVRRRKNLPPIPGGDQILFAGAKNGVEPDPPEEPPADPAEAAR